MKVIGLCCFIFLAVLGVAISGLQAKILSTNENRKEPIVDIIKGKNATIQKYPFMASLLIGGRVGGSGVIIDKKWIMTSAYNLYKHDVSELKFRVGSNFYDKGGKVLEIEKVIINEKFKLGSWDYDIGVVKVKQIKLGRKTKIVDLGTEELKGGTKASIAGWGEKEETGIASEHLLATKVTVLARDECAKTYKEQLTPRMLCTFDKKVGPCAGDFGDPIIIGNAVFGMFSGGFHCTPGVHPVVYTNVPPLADWVKNAIKNG